MLDTRTMSPAAAAVLLDPKASRGAELLKVAVTWLIGSGALKVETREKKGLLGTSSKTYLVPVQIPSLPQHAAAIVAVVGSDSLPLEQFITKAKSRFGSDISKLKEMIIQELIEVGFLKMVSKKTLLVFSTRSYEPTAEGEGVKQQITGSLQSLGQVRSIVSTNPTKAAALVAAAGSLVFLVPELRPAMTELSNVVSALATSADFNADAWGTIDFSNLSELFSSGFDAFDTSFDSIDSGGDSNNDSGIGGD